MNALLLDRLRVVIRTGVEQLSADDVTDCGRIAVDPNHGPNNKQNGIGSLFRHASQMGWLENTHRSVPSVAPHRKGGAISVWLVTPAGRDWAGEE